MRRLAFAVLFALIPTVAFAQEPYAEQVVVTGHAEEVTFASLAREVVVFTREDLAHLPVRSIADVLALTAGVDVRSRGPWGVQTDFSIRGGTFGQTLVLVDGVRLNDSQTAHHNGDIPVPMDEIERIEVLLGPGSSLYGADAFGGTINVITRRTGSYAAGSFSAGSDGYVSGSGGVAGTARDIRESIAFSADRASGFEPDREFRTLSFSSQTRFANGIRVWASHLDKQFGANGFYGPAQSTEGTDQTLVSADGALTLARGWTGQWQTAYRDHGDTFVYDRFHPGTPNRHRDDAMDLAARAGRDAGQSTHVTVGAETGVDWIRSNNLGDHSLARVSGFAELQQRLGGRATMYAGARMDHYSTFGSAFSPSLAAVGWLGQRAKVHASIGHAFRVPTFTDRFYSDPSNVGNPALTPERAWGSDAGVELFLLPGLSAGATVFDRRDRDTIDFVRASPSDRWRAENIRAVLTNGIELSARERVGANATASASYAFVDASTGAVPLLSHYALDVARHALSLAVTYRLRRLDLGGHAGYTRRQDGREYWLADLRVARPVRWATFFVDATNLFDTRYQEIVGVDMPGRQLRAGLTVRK